MTAATGACACGGGVSVCERVSATSGQLLEAGTHMHRVCMAEEACVEVLRVQGVAAIASAGDRGV